MKDFIKLPEGYDSETKLFYSETTDKLFISHPMREAIYYCYDKKVWSNHRSENINDKTTKIEKGKNA